MNTNPTVRGQLRLITCAALCVFAVAACNGSGKSNGGAPGAGGGPGAAVPTTVSLEFGVHDVTSVPIAGAEVAVTIAGVQHHSTAGANGVAVFPPLPIGIMDLSIMAYRVRDYCPEWHCNRQRAPALEYHTERDRRLGNRPGARARHQRGRSRERR